MRARTRTCRRLVFFLFFSAVAAFDSGGGHLVSCDCQRHQKSIWLIKKIEKGCETNGAHLQELSRKPLARLQAVWRVFALFASGKQFAVARAHVHTQTASAR